MLKSTVGACLPLLFVGARVFAGDNYDLKLRLRQGQGWTFEQTFDGRQRSRMSAAGQQPMEGETTMRSVRKGTITVLAVNSGVPTALRVAFDPGCTTKMSQMGKEQTVDYPFAGITVTLRRSADGQVTTEFDRQPTKEADPMTRRELEAYLVNNQGRPAQPVAIGEQWQPDFKQIRQMYQLTDQDQVSGSTKLAAIATINGRRAAELTSVSSISRRQGEMAMTEQTKGSLWLDLETGQLVKSTSEATSTAKGPQTMPGPNGEQRRIEMDNSGKSTMRLTTTPGNPGSGGGALASTKQAVNPLGGAPSPVNPLAAKPGEPAGAAPKAAASAANAGSARAGNSAAPSYFRMKLARVMDAHGFEKPITAITLLIPTDWTVQGGVDWGSKGPGGVVTFRASSPDGRTAVEAFPPTSWEWSSDPSTVQSMQRQRATDAQRGLSSSEIGPPLTARDYLTKYVVPRSRAGARFLGADVVPESAQAVANDIRKAQQEAPQDSFRTQLQGDTARIHIAYERDRQAEEEWLTGVTYARGTSYPAVSQTISYSCGAVNVFGFCAPAGRLEATEKLFRVIVKSIRPDPNWQARVQRIHGNIANVKMQNAVKQSQITAKTFEDTQQIISDTFQHRQQSQDRISEQRSQEIRGVEPYRDPSSGETVELSNAYGYAWKNGRGEYLLSDSPSFDPSVELKEDWTRLEHAEPSMPPE